MARDVLAQAGAVERPSGAGARAARGFARVALALLPAVAVGTLAQRGLGFDLVSLEDESLVLRLVLWPVVLMGLGLAAVAVVVLPVGRVLRRLPATRVAIVVRVACEAALGTALFRLVSFPISGVETLLVALPQAVFFAAYHALGGRLRAPSQSP